MLQDAGTKKRKATYLRRKEEHDALQDQIQEIERQLTELRAKNDGGVTQLQELIAAVGLNTTMKNAVEQQQLKVAMAQSSVSQWLQNQSVHPMNNFIHLGREWTERRETLLSMKDERLARGFRYVTAWCQHLAALKPHLSEERLKTQMGISAVFITR
ncbi:hypothetical protein PC128_g11604 [Phytophthora cactorum]|nr:hypothetical protein PC128_g11604 [Phytophthora cactorum]